MILMLTAIACLLFSTLDNMATPCSVNAIGKYLSPPQLEVTICDLKLRNSFLFNLNMKSFGNLSF